MPKNSLNNQIGLANRYLVVPIRTPETSNPPKRGYWLSPNTCIATCSQTASASGMVIGYCRQPIGTYQRPIQWYRRNWTTTTTTRTTTTTTSTTTSTKAITSTSTTTTTTTTATTTVTNMLLQNRGSDPQHLNHKYLAALLKVYVISQLV